MTAMTKMSSMRMETPWARTKTRMKMDGGLTSLNTVNRSRGRRLGGGLDLISIFYLIWSWRGFLGLVILNST